MRTFTRSSAMAWRWRRTCVSLLSVKTVAKDPQQKISVKRTQHASHESLPRCTMAKSR